MSVQFTISQGHIICDDSNLILYDVLSWEERQVNRLKGLMAISRDLDYAEAYLKQMFFDKCTTLIDGALLTGAIQLLVKCFTESEGSRTRLDYKRVYRTYTQEIGENDLTKSYESFVNARNTVISHDQDGYKNGIVSIVVNQNTGEAMDVIAIAMKKSYLYKKNQEIGMRLVNIAKSFVEIQIKKAKKKLVSIYNDNKPELNNLVLPEGLIEDNTW